MGLLGCFGPTLFRYRVTVSCRSKATTIAPPKHSSAAVRARGSVPPEPMGGEEDPDDPPKKAAVALASPSPPSPALLYATLFAVQLVFVIWIYVAKFAMAEVDLPPLVFAAYREVVATVSLLAMVKCSGGAGVKVGDVRRLTRSFLLLGFLMFVNVAGFITGLSMVKPFNAAILQPTQPIFASAIAWACRYESMSPMKALSVGMATAGAAMTVWFSSVASGGEVSTGEPQQGGDDESDLNPPLGNAILLFQCVCGGAMWVVQKRVLSEVKSPVVVTAISYTIASVLTVSVTVASRGLRDPLLYVTSPVAWASIAYAALLATVFTYYAMAWANKWANPSTVTLSLSIQPLLSALFTAVGGGPPLVPPQILSCGLIIAGLCVKVYDQERQAVGGEESIELPSKEAKPLIT